MLDDIKPEKFHEPASSPSGAPEKRVGHFRQILLWPVHLLSGASGRGTQNHAAVLGGLGEGNPWREVADEFTGDPASFQERHYNEFVTFLPPVQRFLYGNGRGRVSGAACGESPITVMRRSDITGLRVTLMPGAAAIELNVAHIDLYFFFDIDIAILALEVFADDVRLATAQDAMFRLGRAYPAFWEPGGAAGHCPVKVELISANGSAVAASDYQDREAFLAHVGEKRAARIAAHWEYLLRPMVPHDSNLPGRLRYKQLEYYRMPQMALLAVTGDTELTRADYVRLAFASGPGDCNQLPFADRHLADFEQKYCYDRYFGQHSEVEWPESRYMSCRGK